MTCCASPLPGEIPAGLDFQASVTLPDPKYAAGGWSVKAILRGPQNIEIVGALSGQSHVFSASGATTGKWMPGSYWYTVRATLGTSIVEVGKGQLTILPDLAAATPGFDGRTQNQIALDAINAVLAKRATQDQQRYVINNRELWRTPIADLMKLRGWYVLQVKRECAKNSGRSTFGRAINVRFTSQ